MKHKIFLGSIAFFLAIIAFSATSGITFAHEKRHVGPYTFVVGFLNEPAYANQQNSIDLTICKGTACNYTVKNGVQVLANPVSDANTTLKAEVIMGSATPLSLPLELRYNNPGKYSAYFIPSKVGTYTFHFTGSVDGVKVDERFTSGPNTFSDAAQSHMYPPVATQNTNMTSSVQNQITDAQHSASTATTLGIVGTIVGILGILIATFALLRKSQGPGANPANVKNLQG